MNGRMIGILIRKDLMLFFRNRLFAPITAYMMIMTVAIFLFMPDKVEESFKIGIYAPVKPSLLNSILDSQGQYFQRLDSENDLRNSVLNRDYEIGLALIDDPSGKTFNEGKGQVNVYFGAKFPKELRQTVVVLLKELFSRISGGPSGFELTQQILGPDMAGRQIPLRDRLLPLFVVLILMLETMGLATLISEEIEKRTIQALLITPLRIESLMVSKAAVGIGLAFFQVLLLMGILGGLSHQPLLIIVSLFLGSLLVTGMGFAIASAAKNMMSVFAWGFLAMVILFVASFGSVLPGEVSAWMKAIPSYYLANIIYKTSNFNTGWSESSFNLLVLFAFGTGFLILGSLALKRRLG